MGKGAYLLYESAAGYGLFEVVEAEEIGAQDAAAQDSITDLQRFSKMVKLTAFMGFTTAENALQNIMDVSEGVVHDDLKNFLEANLPKVKVGKKAKFYLGVSAPNLGSAVQEGVGFPCKSNETVLELLRGVRLHFSSYVKPLNSAAMKQAQLGLGHSYSRSKVKFNVNRQDNMIIQSICLLDQLDKDINTCAMRVREWYSWHFPELNKIVSDVYVYARLVQMIASRGSMPEDTALEQLTTITLDEAVSQQIIDAGQMSMGMDVSEIDMINIKAFALKVSNLAVYRKKLHEYLQKKMSVVAPNLGALIGEPVAARLISHAGSLTNLAKCPASTVQILGAEKALFRALKSKGNTPKYGLIFHSSFIGRAAAKNKGRISRYLANKCSIAARIDSFSDEPNSAYGEKLRDQVEERLKFYDTGEAPRRNIDVMKEVAASLGAASGGGDAMEEEDGAAAAAAKPKKAKKEKKSKKRKAEAEAAPAEEAPPEKKKKKKKEKKAKKEKKKK